jgi:hypothetical protein
MDILNPIARFNAQGIETIRVREQELKRDLFL